MLCTEIFEVLRPERTKKEGTLGDDTTTSCPGLLQMIGCAIIAGESAF